MEYKLKSEGNLETVNDGISMKIPNFVLKENNQHTPLNYFESNSNPKNIPSPIYEYFDTSQKFLKNNERNFGKSIHSLLSTKGVEISPQSKEISLKQQTPNFNDNFFGIKGQSPSQIGNGLTNQEISEYLKTKQHLLTQNYKNDINENNAHFQKERVVNIKNMNRNLVEMTPEVGEEDEGFENNIEKEFEQKQMNDFNMNQNKIGNVMFHNNNFPSDIQTNNQQSLNKLNIPHINNHNYNQIKQQPQSNYLMNNSINQLNNNNESNYNFQQSSFLNKHNQFQDNPSLNVQMEQQMFYSTNKPPNNQFIPQNMPINFHNKNSFQQQEDTIGTKNHQQMQLLQYNNNNSNIGMTTDYMQNVQNYSLSHLNPECYIFERFGKRGWQCEKCNNFNFECKFILYIYFLIVRVICNKCKNNMIPKIIDKQAQFTEPKEKKKKPLIERKGDWMCPRCRNLNFTFRLTCNRCNLSKTDAEFMNMQSKPHLIDQKNQSSNNINPHFQNNNLLQNNFNLHGQNNLGYN